MRHSPSLRIVLLPLPVAPSAPDEWESEAPDGGWTRSAPRATGLGVAWGSRWAGLGVAAALAIGAAWLASP